jgi:hypothetical protein
LARTTEWIEVPWPYNDDMIKELAPVYTKKIGRVRFHLFRRPDPTWPVPNLEGYLAKYSGLWNYCAEAGSNHDLSHSGLIMTRDLEQAKHYCETEVETR